MYKNYACANIKSYWIDKYECVSVYLCCSNSNDNEQTTLYNIFIYTRYSSIYILYIRYVQVGWCLCKLRTTFLQWCTQMLRMRENFHCLGNATPISTSSSQPSSQNNQPASQPSTLMLYTKSIAKQGTTWHSFKRARVRMQADTHLPRSRKHININRILENPSFS